MIYFCLFMIGAFLFGFIAGVTIKDALDRDEIIGLERKNAKLHAQLMQAARTNVETIEIVDPRVGESVDFSKNW